MMDYNKDESKIKILKILLVWAKMCKTSELNNIHFMKKKYEEYNILSLLFL